MGLRFSDRTDTHGGTEALPSYSHSSDVQQCLGAFGVILTRGGWVFFFSCSRGKTPKMLLQACDAQPPHERISAPESHSAKDAMP